MEQSPSPDANSSSASQETRRILWNPKSVYLDVNSLPLVQILSQINSVHAISPHLNPT